MNKYIQILDYIRAFCVLLVAYGHIFQYGSDASLYFGNSSTYLSPLNIETVRNLIGTRYINIGEIGVSLFFLISTFLLYPNLIDPNLNLKKFTQKKILRILPTAFIAVVICFIISMFLKGDSDEIFTFLSVKTIIVNGLLLQEFIPVPIVNPTFWFLFVIVKLYIFVVILNILKVKSLWAPMLFMLSFVCLNNVFNANVSLKLSTYVAHVFNVMSYAFVHMMYAFIGFFIYRIFDKGLFSNIFSKKFLLSILEILLVFSCFVLAKEVYNLNPYKLPNFEMNYFISLVFFLFAMKIESKSIKLPLNRFVKVISDSSYQIYTLHYQVGAILLFSLTSTKIIENNFIIYFIVFSGVILISRFVFLYIDQPLSNYVFSSRVFSEKKKVSITGEG